MILGVRSCVVVEGDPLTRHVGEVASCGATAAIPNHRYALSLCSTPKFNGHHHPCTWETVAIGFYLLFESGAYHDLSTEK
jgi:hypothetical protein